MAYPKKEIFEADALEKVGIFSEFRRTYVVCTYFSILNPVGFFYRKKS